VIGRRRTTIEKIVMPSRCGTTPVIHNLVGIGERMDARRSPVGISVAPHAAIGV
jgi:hypothetical protein